MRVIAGSARHLKLKTIEGMGTRPTTDRIKETLFNMLSFYVEESRFLDLFSGSGGIGIEALSRGASQAVFVEQNRKAAACIEENLNHTHLREKAVVMSKDVMTALRILEDKNKHLITYLWTRHMESFWKRSCFIFRMVRCFAMRTQQLLLSQILIQNSPGLWTPDLPLQKEKIYKTNKHTFLQKK